jgi:hypothetical protein
MIRMATMWQIMAIRPDMLAAMNKFPIDTCVSTTKITRGSDGDITLLSSDSGFPSACQSVLKHNHVIPLGGA